MKRTLGIGGVTTDQIGVVDHILGSDEVIHLEQYRVEQGGMAATALVAAARLGAEVEFMGGVGDDANGRLALDRFAMEGVAAPAVWVFSGGISAFSVILVERESGKRTIIHEPGVQKNHTLEIPEAAAQRMLSRVGYLHLDGYWMDTAIELSKEANRMGIPITLDIGQNQRNANIETLLGLADYVIPSLPFTRRFTESGQIEQAAETLLGYGAQAVIQTLREEGAFVSTKEGQSFQVPAFAVPVVDTTGAGDSFPGGFVFALSRGYDLKNAVIFASAVAALKCTHLGGQSGLPSFSQVEEFLTKRGTGLL